MFGSEGDGEGEFKFFGGIVLIKDGWVMVVDRYNYRV